MSRVETDWTDSLIAQLRALWDEGHSIAEIGRRMGVSKNAAVGKAHRLDLPARPSPLKTVSTKELLRRITQRDYNSIAALRRKLSPEGYRVHFVLALARITEAQQE